MGKISVSWAGSELEWLKFINVRSDRKFLLPQNPLEDGTPVIDHRVQLPAEVTVTCCFNNNWADPIAFSSVKPILERMIEAKLNANNIATITDKAGFTYDNMVLESFSHTEDNGEKFDNYYFDLKFKEVKFLKKGGSSSSGENSKTASK